jgi:hypothetical protein
MVTVPNCFPGTFRLIAGQEGKYFFRTAEEAATFARRAYAHYGPSTITSGRFPTSALPGGIEIAGEGTGYFLPGSLFPHGPVSILNWAPIP